MAAASYALPVQHATVSGAAHPVGPQGWGSLPSCRRSTRAPRLRGVCTRAASDRDFDSVIAREMAFMDRQMQLLDRDIERQMSQWDSEMSRIMQRSEAMQQEAQRQAEQAIQRAQQGINDPNVRIYRSEERGSNSYRFQESITITSGSRYLYTTQTVGPAVGPSPLLFVAALMAGMYAALAAAFVRNADLTTYKEKGVWRLALIWPVLLIASPRFREQFFNAVRGIKSRVTNTDSQDSVRSQDSL